MSLDAGFTSPLSAAKTITAIQSSAVAAQGELTNATDDRVDVILPAYASAALLKELEGQDMGAVSFAIAVFLTPLAQGTAVRVVGTPSMFYLLNQMGVTASTFDGFVRLLGETIKAISENRRPPAGLPEFP